MKKKVIAFLLAGMMLCLGGNIFSEGSSIVCAEENADFEEGNTEVEEEEKETLIGNGRCGVNALWTLNEQGILIISGSGAIDDASGYSRYDSYIKEIQIGTDISEITKEAFSSLNKVQNITALNKEYIIYDSAETFPDGCTLCGYADSTLYEYAKKYGKQFVCYEHVWNTEYTVEQEATCTSKGQKSIHCSGCSAVKEGSSLVIPLKDHTWKEEYTVDTKATTATDGSMSIQCSVCETKKDGSEVSIAKISTENFQKHYTHTVALNRDQRLLYKILMRIF